MGREPPDTERDQLRRPRSCKRHIAGDTGMSSAEIGLLDALNNVKAYGRWKAEKRGASACETADEQLRLKRQRISMYHP
jgi:hypothetical protein